MKVLELRVNHHVKEEENDLFPMYEKELSPQILEDLGTKLERRKFELLSAQNKP